MKQAFLILILSIITNGCATSPYNGNRSWKSARPDADLRKDFLECQKDDRRNGYFQTCMEYRGHFFIADDWTVAEYVEWVNKR